MDYYCCIKRTERLSDVPPEVTQYTQQSLSAIHHALRASRRRLVIGLLAYRELSTNKDGSTEEVEPKSPDTAGPVQVNQLAKEIVAIEEEVPIEHATGNSYHSVYTSLCQTHLMKLDDVGAIDYHDERKIVRSDENLIPLAMVSALTSPIAQTLFHSGISEHDLGGPKSLADFRSE